jgi:hypothetical protein
MLRYDELVVMRKCLNTKLQLLFEDKTEGEASF